MFNLLYLYWNSGGFYITRRCSILSILQMPGGVPVATVALDGAKNAGILAAQIIGASDKCVLDKIIAYKEGLKLKVEKASERVKK